MVVDRSISEGMPTPTSWPDRLHRSFAGIRIDVGEWSMLEPGRTELLVDEHVLLGTLAGGALGVEVRAEGSADWRGPKLPGAAGFFPGGRMMRSCWPANRLSFIKLSIAPDATAELLQDRVEAADWQTRSSAEDPFISVTLARLASALERPPDDRLALLTIETLVAALHLHVVARFSALRIVDHIGGGLTPVLDLIHASLPHATSLSDMVTLSGLSRARFLTAFVRLTGYSPHRYIIRERMARARHLLETTRRPISEVAMVVGCANPGHLTRLYRNEFDSTPLAWRQRHGRL